MDFSDDTIVLKKETVEGFVDRGGNFRTDGAKTMVAERWVSEPFNIRLKAETTVPEKV